MDASTYTYLLVNQNGAELWIAVPQMEVAVGEVIYYKGGMEMIDFESKTLNRKFDKLLMVQEIKKEPKGEEMMSATHSQLSSLPKEDVNIEPVRNGKTIEQIYSEKSSLNGKMVTVKGKVTKYNPDIMDRNWIHIQDGTGSDGTHDLLVTSNSSVNMGDIIVVKGKLALDKDYGSGYKYAVVLEEGEITAE
jgi:hypothetical protein